MAFTKRQHEIAKEKALHLVSLEIVGKYVKQDGVAFSGPVGPKTAKLFNELVNRLLDVKERMK